MQHITQTAQFFSIFFQVELKNKKNKKERKKEGMFQSLKKRLSGSSEQQQGEGVEEGGKEPQQEEEEGVENHANISLSFSENNQIKNYQQLSHITSPTIQQIQLLSTLTKVGYLSFQKTNSLIVRWKRKYFILGANYLRRYNTNESIEKEEFYKELLLTDTSTVTRTDIGTCFIVKSMANPISTTTNSNLDNEEIERLNTWILQAETAEEANDWIVHISSHIHQIYLQQHPELQINEINKKSKQQITFWTLPTTNSHGPVVNPVGIRSVPDQNGPRTGSGIYPGEIFEVSQQIYSNNGTTILQLSDDRGYVFDKHPIGGYDLIIPLQSDKYLYQERNVSLVVNKNLVRIFFYFIF